jgi:hypothetical protein
MFVYVQAFAALVDPSVEIPAYRWTEVQNTAKDFLETWVTSHSTGENRTSDARTAQRSIEKFAALRPKCDISMIHCSVAFDFAALPMQPLLERLCWGFRQNTECTGTSLAEC